MMKPFQRVGSKSNTHVGREFEKNVRELLARRGLPVRRNFKVPVGVSTHRKPHAFDFGSDGSPPLLVECKSHKWTAGSNVPSGKLRAWNEAMYLFSAAPREYRKMFVVLKDLRDTSGETLAAYYLRNYEHLIPDDVEVWEYDEALDQAPMIRNRRQR